MEPPQYPKTASSRIFSSRYSSVAGQSPNHGQGTISLGLDPRSRVADLQAQVADLHEAISRIDPGSHSYMPASRAPDAAAIVDPSPGSMYIPANVDGMLNERGPKVDSEDMASNRSTDTSPYNSPEDANWRYVEAVEGGEQRKQFLDSSAILEEGESSSNASTPQRGEGKDRKMRSWLERAKGARQEAMSYADESVLPGRGEEKHRGSRELHSSSSSESDDDHLFEPNAVRTHRAAGDSSSSEFKSARSIFLQHLRDMNKDEDEDDHEYSLDDPPLHGYDREEVSPGIRDSYVEMDRGFTMAERYAYTGASMGKGLSDHRNHVHRGEGYGQTAGKEQLDFGSRVHIGEGDAGMPHPYLFQRSHSYTLGSKSDERHRDGFSAYVGVGTSKPHTSNSDEIRRNGFSAYVGSGTSKPYTSREPSYNSDAYTERTSHGAPPDSTPRKLQDEAPGTDQARATVYEYRCRELEKRLQQAESEAAAYADSLSELHAVFKATAEEALESRKKEKALRAQVERLQTENRRHASNRTAVEQLFNQKLDLSNSERDMLAMQLAQAYEEIAVRDASLADSAAYMQALRRRNAELQVQVRALLVERCKDGQQNSGRDEGDSTGVFSLANIKKNIQDAVRELATMSDNDKKDRIKALRLRWHPDKNPVLQEFATEVTKIINDEVMQLGKESS